MRNITLLKSGLLAIAIIVSSTIASANTYIHTIGAKTWSAYDTQNLSTIAWTATATGGVYFGYDPTKGQQFGSSSNPATALSLKTSGFSGTITSIKITTAGASSFVGNVAVSVGGTAFLIGSAANATLTSTSTVYDFVGSASGAIAINWLQTSSKALYLKAIEITYSTAITSSTITLTPATLSGFGYNFGNAAPSAEQSFTVGGALLTADLIITPSANYEISLATGDLFAPTSPITIAQANGNVPNTTIYTRLKSGLAVANYNENITITSTDAATKTVTCNGSVACVASGLAFPSASIIKVVGNDKFIATPTSSNTVSAITYSSSMQSVATVNASTGEVTIMGGGTTEITAAQAAGEGYCASTAKYSLVVASKDPTITITEVIVLDFATEVSNVATQQINVSGVNLASNIALSITGSDEGMFQVSKKNIAPTNGTANNSEVLITYVPTTAGIHTATLTLSSAGAYDIIMALNGTSTWLPIVAPIATDATEQGVEEFTANWSAVVGATEYLLSVNAKQDGSTIASDLFISEYVEGLNNNKAIEIFNGTGAAVDLSAYSIRRQNNGLGLFTNEQVLSGTLANNDVYVLANTTASEAILAMADANNNTTTLFTGNDAVALYKNGVKIDEVGLADQIIDWGKDQTLIRKSDVVTPKATYTAAEWDIQGTDYISNLGTHTSTGAGIVTTPITGSPFLVVSSTSKKLTNLATSSTYTYTVKARNSNVTSTVSNEITAYTLAAGLIEVYEQLNVGVVNGDVVFTASANEKVVIYNTIGQQIINKLTSEGINIISINSHGVLLVKVGNKVAKVIL